MLERDSITNKGDSKCPKIDVESLDITDSSSSRAKVKFIQIQNTIRIATTAGLGRA